MTTPPSIVRTQLFGRSAIRRSARHSKAGFTALESLIVLGVVAVISWVLFALWKHEEPEATEREVPAHLPPTLLVRPDATPPAEPEAGSAATSADQASDPDTSETDDAPTQDPAVARDGR